MLEKLINDPRAAADKIEDTLLIVPELFEKHPTAIKVGAGVVSSLAAFYIMGEADMLHTSPMMTSLTNFARVGVSGAAGMLTYTGLSKLKTAYNVSEQADLLTSPREDGFQGKPLSEYRTAAAGDIKQYAQKAHLFIDAGTGGGKTVFISAMAEYLAEIHNWEYFVIDPKMDGDPDLKWPSASLKLYDEKYFIPFLKKANLELTRRKNSPNKNYRHMVILIDEAPEVTGASEEAVYLVSRLSKLGLAFHIHIWLASQSSRIAEVGFEGRKDVLLQNFTAVKLRELNGAYEFAFMRRSGEDFRVIDHWYPTPNLWHNWKNVGDKPIEDSNLLREFGAKETDNTRKTQIRLNSVTDTRQHSTGSDQPLPLTPCFPSPPPTPQADGRLNGRDGTKNGSEPENERDKLMGIMLRASEKSLSIDRVLRAIQAHEAKVSITEVTRILLDLTGDVGGPNRTKTRYVLGVE